MVGPSFQPLCEAMVRADVEQCTPSFHVCERLTPDVTHLDA